MNTDNIVDFLKDRPDFFTHHPDLLASLHIPHQGGEVISLVERQVRLLREKVKNMEADQHEMMSYGEENDIIIAQIHRLALDLLAQKGRASRLRAIYMHLSSTFCVPYVGIRIWGLQGEGKEFSPVSDTVREYARELHHPWCGGKIMPELLPWIENEDERAMIKTGAVLVLRDMRTGDKEPFGMLVLGSEENRFYTGIGATYLNRIGELVSVALLQDG